MKEIKVIKLTESAQLPAYEHEGDSGMDLRAIAPHTLAPGETALIKTGLAIELPASTEAQVRPRSGLALKRGVGNWDHSGHRRRWLQRRNCRHFN